jgi:elongation factor Ts
LIEQTGVEKIEISGFEILEGAFVGSYVHVNKIALTAISAAV